MRLVIVWLCHVAFLHGEHGLDVLNTLELQCTIDDLVPVQ